MAGTIDVVQRSFAGLRPTEDALIFAPQMPTGIRSVAFHVRYRGQLLKVKLDREHLDVASSPGDASPARIRVRGEEIQLQSGTSHRFRHDRT